MASAFQPGKTAGIDLGTTRSTLAHLDEYGKAAVIPNADAELVTPSVVLIDEGDVVIVGNDAKNQAVAAGHRVIRESKREIGRTDMKWEIDGKTYQPEMIGSMVLRKLKKDAPTAPRRLPPSRGAIPSRTRRGRPETPFGNWSGSAQT